jgi:hypothetical protein
MVVWLPGRNGNFLVDDEGELLPLGKALTSCGPVYADPVKLRSMTSRHRQLRRYDVELKSNKSGIYSEVRWA